MTRVEFDQLVEGLEEKFRGRRDALTRSSIRWALFGYVVLSVAIVCSLALLAGCVFFIILHPNVVTIKFGGVLGVAAGALSLTLFRSLWNRLHPPQGREITRDEAPALFGMIDDISEAAGGVRFHKVLLTNDLNASVVQLPLAGIFGMHRNYLSLGLPLMDALEPEEFKAVLAHEFSHLSSKDGSTGNWIYRIRVTWERAAEGIFQKDGFLIAPLKKFFVWFWPRFNARAFVLSRSNEYQADAFAAKVTSPATSARALQRIDLRARHLEDVFWKNINLRVADEPQPPSAIFGEMKDFLRTDPEPAAASRWLSHAFSISTGTSDTHPSLSDRVRTLGMPVDSRTLPTLRAHASDALLGADLSARAREAFSGEWQRFVLDDWQSTHKSRAESRANCRNSPPRRRAVTAGRPGGSVSSSAWRRRGSMPSSRLCGTTPSAIRTTRRRHSSRDSTCWNMTIHPDCGSWNGWRKIRRTRWSAWARWPPTMTGRGTMTP
ncbi:M48 family metallopeptidase [Luteolibacter sp. SL250]|uniref:M48 family metallopeptidase n=1 Tax=Luteolibacter sp. SL250 TaxID=2995170 RepID=UPI00226E5B89|nr:M48 family metallopeptidase [Luteolibacter sp. SL250]WAC19850.1 M48 family metallopeptidase [Luteolibacter sp. SL250]